MKSCRLFISGQDAHFYVTENNLHGFLGKGCQGLSIELTIIITPTILCTPGNHFFNFFYDSRVNHDSLGTFIVLFLASTSPLIHFRQDFFPWHFSPQEKNSQEKIPRKNPDRIFCSRILILDEFGIWNFFLEGKIPNENSKEYFSLRQLMEKGSSLPWTETLYQATGESRIDGSAMREYFRPLEDWLRNENLRTQEFVGWVYDGDYCKQSIETAGLQVYGGFYNAANPSASKISIFFIFLGIILNYFT